MVTESFLPRVNGVSGSVCRVVELLTAAGHEVLVVAPGPGPDRYDGAPLRLVPSLRLPFDSTFPIGLPSPRVTAWLHDFAPDVVHLASPVVLGAAGAVAARTLGVPSVAVFQTDVAGFARRHGLGATTGAVWAWLRRVHELADRTLAPSPSAVDALLAHGVPRVHLWPRGVDLARFAPEHRSPALRRALAPDGEVLVGYVGRLAREKQVERLACLADLPGVRLVVVGAGPQEPALRRRLPGAAFLGFQTGAALSRAFASLDVFVHTGTAETFCQTVQEAMACGLPVVAPAVGGPADLVLPGRTGLLHPPADLGGLRAAVALLAGDRELRGRMGAAGRVAVADRAWPGVGAALLAHYRAVQHPFLADPPLPDALRLPTGGGGVPAAAPVR